VARLADQLDQEATTEGTGVPTINCVIFSKDRAMQLDACLRSIERLGPYAGPIAVVWKATTPEFGEGYRLLDLGRRVRLIPQSDDFRRDVMGTLDPNSEHTVFHTDDDVFFRRSPAAPILSDEFAAFSFRLGHNTTYCYTLGRAQVVPGQAVDGPVIAWDWTRAKDDFSYPMSLDGHVFQTRLLLRMLRRARFDNPNQLEEELHLRRYLAPHTMLSFRESCLVSIPANVVSPTHRNRASDDAELSPEVLNARYLVGERIDLERMNFSGITSAHQEVPFAFASVRA
jgi:hypothetical protein